MQGLKVWGRLLNGHPPQAGYSLVQIITPPDVDYATIIYVTCGFHFHTISISTLILRESWLMFTDREMLTLLCKYAQQERFVYKTCRAAQ